MVKTAIENALDWLGTLVFPGLLVVLSLGTLAWQVAHVDHPVGKVVPVQVWEQTRSSAAGTTEAVLREVRAAKPVSAFNTELSTNDFWFLVPAPSAKEGAGSILEFPSRHTSHMTCWDSKSDRLLGSGDRTSVEGVFQYSQAGFAIPASGLEGVSQVLCRGAFRGPAKISAKAWDATALAQAQKGYELTGSLLEAGIGVLTLTMLITALINRSWLYWAFVGWLILNMRMAAISEGTDFFFFGVGLGPDLLIASRKWTACLFFSMTVAMFGLLFKSELKAVKANFSLTVMQLAAIVLPVLCFFMSFEALLQWLWVFVSIGAAVGFFNLFRILRSARSRVAVWYAASIVVTLVAGINEVLAASFGAKTLSSGLNSATGALTAALLVAAAVAEHMRADRLEKLEAQRVLRTAYEDSPIGLFSISATGAILNANPSFRKMLRSLGLDKATQVSQIFDRRVTLDLASLYGTKSRFIELQTKVHDTQKSQDRWFAIKASTMDGNTVEGTLQDITERFIATERLEFLANHDPLTECLNLRGISRTLGRLARQPAALAYFDLDRFKLINDLYGHSAGDMVLKQVCHRMQMVVGTDAMLSRVGGDEFVIAFSDCNVTQATALCESIIKSIASEPYQIGRQRFSLNVSAGLVGTDRFKDAPLKEVISAADTLCRMAKKRPAQRLLVMESDNNFFRSHKEELEVLVYLERGEVPQGLFLMMQPEISLTEPFESLNFEILVRMRKLDGDVIPAGVIIEAAEMHGKTAIIDRWVITTAIAWIEAHLGELSNTRFISINLSGGSLNDEAFTDELFTLFEQHAHIVSLLCIEITESVALTDITNVQRFIDRLRSLGAKVAIDDFGAGYSSFGYLRNLSVDALKIDGSLVKGATRSTAGLAIIDAIGSLVNSLGMKSIGEYAEDLTTIKALVNAGIDYAQGYGISRPVMPERLLTAKSCADFIEDADILTFITQLHTVEDRNLPLFDPPNNGLIH